MTVGFGSKPQLNLVFDRKREAPENKFELCRYEKARFFYKSSLYTQEVFIKVDFSSLGMLI
jgi:hypothetical protein